MSFAPIMDSIICCIQHVYQLWKLDKEYDEEIGSTGRKYVYSNVPYHVEYFGRPKKRNITEF